LKKLFLASKSFPHSSFQRRELRLELEVGVVQLRMGEGGLGLQGAVVVPAEEDEQGRDEEDEAGGGAHRASWPAAAQTLSVKTPLRSAAP